ncbi:class II glutamine amidotransferase [Deinococcus hohokamensis]|uniref:Glutamine amidotransferase type-2 domain-containing protein n=1 Tax=Deinococcus hohokamensis TaxID=309883 RepID=A0ABV9I4B9_9DEIO
MCGLYAYHRRSGPPQANLLTYLAHLAGTRGPHGHGHATQGQRHVALGQTNPARVSTVVDSVIGHARLATAGSHGDLACVQPLLTGTLFVAHNGTVPAYREQAAVHGLTLETDSDSEVLAQLLARARSLEGVAGTLDLLTPGLPLALLVLAPDGSVTAARRGHPLYARRAPEGVYLCSLPFDGGEALPDSTVTRFDVAGEVSHPLATTASLRAAKGGPAWTL